MKMKNQLAEVEAQRDEQENRISSLENRNLNNQRETTNLRDQTDKLENQVCGFFFFLSKISFLIKTNI